MQVRTTNPVTDDLLGDVVQICLVTKSHVRTMDSLLRLGIGPFRVHKHHPGTISNTRFRGNAHTFTAVMAYAYSANIMWEIVEPVEGTGVFDEFLAQKGEGVHHFGFQCKGRSYSEALAEFERRGFNVVQSGRVWGGQIGFAFIGTYDELGVFFEIWDHPPGFGPPDPDSWYPAKPIN
jgi:methylmalonyl-CoA/ethylmalonyl-CoA epimerase